MPMWKAVHGFAGVGRPGAGVSRPGAGAGRPVPGSGDPSATPHSAPAQEVQSERKSLRGRSLLLGEAVVLRAGHGGPLSELENGLGAELEDLRG